MANRYQRTSSGAGSSIRSTTCALPTRPRTPNCSTHSVRTSSTTSTACKGMLGENDLQEPHLSARGGAERVQQGGQAVVRAVLPEAAPGRGPVRRGRQADRQSDHVRRAPVGSLRPEPGDHAAGRVVHVVLPGRDRPPATDQRLRVRAGERGKPRDEPALAEQPGGARQDRPGKRRACRPARQRPAARTRTQGDRTVPARDRCATPSKEKLDPGAGTHRQARKGTRRWPTRTSSGRC